MTIVLEIFFFISLFCLFHTYILFPLILKILSVNKSLPEYTLPPAEKLPYVSVLLAAYNEEKVMSKKIESVFFNNYPHQKLEMVIGSDGSTDRTDEIILKFIEKGYNIQFKRFSGRNGKTAILNELATVAKGNIFILTDANIYFSEQTIPQLISNLSGEKTGIAGANIINSGMRKDGISFQENAYIQRENLIKYREGILWGTMMGAFGACYAVKRELLPQIPPNFLMEDFFITMHVLKNNNKAVSDTKAIAYEDVSNLIQEEFKRKVRISAGNFQNLSVYYKLIWPLYKPLGFCFFSHKVLRWLGPVFLFFIYITSALLAYKNLFFLLMFVVQTLGFLIPLIDYMFKKMNTYNFIIRLISYFYIMNFALFIGFIRYIKGIKTSAWTPTIRNIENNE